MKAFLCGQHYYIVRTCADCGAVTHLIGLLECYVIGLPITATIQFFLLFPSLFCGLFTGRIPWITFYLACQVNMWPKNHILPLVILRSAICCTCTKIEMYVLANMKKSCRVHSFYSAKACLVLIINKKARYMYVYDWYMLVCHICCLNFKWTTEHV